jgi:hypothetical protein
MKFNTINLLVSFCLPGFLGNKHTPIEKFYGTLNSTLNTVKQKMIKNIIWFDFFLNFFLLKNPPDLAFPNRGILFFKTKLN